MDSVEAEREALRAAGRFWGDCRCGRPLDRHSRRKVPNVGVDEYICGESDSGRFEPVTLPYLDYSPEKGLHHWPLRDPDLAPLQSGAPR